MFWNTPNDEYYEYVKNPDIPLSGLTTDINLLYLLTPIVILIFIAVNLFKQRLSFAGYIVMILNFIAPFFLLKSLFYIYMDGIWFKTFQRQLLPFLGTYKNVIASDYYYHVLTSFSPEVKQAILKETIEFFIPYFTCPLAMSFGMHLLSESDKPKAPYVVSFLICLLSLAKGWFDGRSNGDIGILILAALGVFLGGLIAKPIAKFIKPKLLKKQEELF